MSSVDVDAIVVYAECGGHVAGYGGAGGACHRQPDGRVDRGRGHGQQYATTPNAMHATYTTVRVRGLNVGVKITSIPN